MVTHIYSDLHVMSIYQFMIGDCVELVCGTCMVCGNAIARQ